MKNKSKKKQTKKNTSNSSSTEKNNINKINSISKSKKNNNIQNHKLIIHKIILENFKSFKGRHEIGFFKNFTVVMGPNGSGKSNILDALCFTLCIGSSYLRSKNTKDIIYKQNSQTNNNNTSEKKNNNNNNCSVEIILIENDSHEISFKKQISSSTGVSQYFYNKSKVSYEEYVKKLENLNIPVHAKSFILAQGAVDSLLAKKNRLCEIIDELSGSSKYKEEYENLFKEIKEKNELINKMSNEINMIKDDKNKVKIQIENEKTYNDLLKKINLIIKKIYLLKLAEQDVIKRTCDERLKLDEEEIKNVEKEKINIITNIKENKKNIEELEIAAIKEEEENSKFKTNIEIINNKINFINENIKTLETEIFNKISQLNQMKNEQKKKLEKKKTYLKEITTITNEINEIKKTLNSETNDKNSNITKEQIKEFRSISINLQNSTINKIKELDSITLQITELNSKKLLLEKTLSSLENQKNELDNDIKNFITETQNLQNLFENKNDEIKILKNNHNKFQKKFTELNNKYNKIYNELQNKFSELSQYELESYENIKRKNISELISKNNKIYGFLFQLIIPLQKKLELPIKVSLIKYLNYLVVEDSETAKFVSEYLKGKEFNCDLLVLENIPIKTIDDSIRMKLSNYGNLIVDLIDTKKKGIKNAINFFVKDLVLCHDINNIKLLREKGFSKIILLDGTIYKKNNISGGNYKNLNQYTFNYSNTNENYLNNENKLKKEIDELSNELKNVIKEKEKNEHDLKSINNLSEKENELEMLKNNFSTKNTELNNKNNLLNEKNKNINNCENQIKIIEKDIKNLNEKYNKTEDELNNVKKEFFSNFMKKYDLKDLNDFNQFSLNEIKKLSNNLKEKEEKILLIQSKIKYLNEFEETLINLDTSIEQNKNNKKDLENKKYSFIQEKNSLLEEYEKFKENNNDSINKINELKENNSKSYELMEKNDKRIRNLLKDKIETQHKIEISLQTKNQIILESKTENDKILKELGEVYENGSYILNIDFDIDNYIIKSVFDEEYKIENKLIYYEDLNLNDKDIDNINHDEIKEMLEKKKEKLILFIKDIQKYVKLIILNNDESSKLKEKEDDLNKQKKAAKEKIENIIKENEQNKEKFNKIKTKRKKKFNKFFTLLQENVSKTYNELTSNNNMPGGGAYLYSNNEDEPYNGVVLYLPTPPGKRVIYDIEQLSGGEKTIAILCLLVCIQKISNTPFLILDEVDAYLDPIHEIVLENLFKQIKYEYQVIIVTHKFNIFRSAESLIGTYFNMKKASSIPISMETTEIY